jgi:hypothetical protein
MPSKTTRPVAVVEDESTLDQMADDANPPEYPQGCPELVPIIAIRPRSRRAEFKRRYADIIGLQGELSTLRAQLGDFDPKDDSVADNPEKAAALYRLWAQSDVQYEIISDLLVYAAVDPAAMRDWVDEADDDALASAFNAYQRRSQPGEVSSSAS